VTVPLPCSPDLEALAIRLAAEMRQRWQQGDRPRVEEFLEAHPILRDAPTAAAELIYEEICLRRAAGLTGASSEVLRRFPEWAGPLRVMLELDETLASEEPAFPAIGEVLGDFQLVAVLGQGQRGRVYLARQLSLAGRPVVVKLAPPADAEHATLARLQHTHIVPLYAAHEDQGAALRVLCLPYFGGATLAAILDRLSPIPPRSRTAEAFWAALTAAQGDTPLAPAVIPPRRLARASYPEVVCWVGACLADALAFAHERGLLHLDVKPSNVLVTATGVPMLLDFHLSRPALPAGAPAPPWLGGTPAYLSPEQRAALEAVRTGSPIGEAVDGRSDLYSLAMVLREALGEPKENPGIAAVVTRCLAPRATDRYPDAASLADDLRRHLAGLPLRGVRNPLRERWRKWRRRRPGALPALLLLLGVLLALGLAAGHNVRRLRQAQVALEEGKRALREGHSTSARGAFQRGLAVVEPLPFDGGLTVELADGLRRADRADAAGELHRVAERLRGLSGRTDDTPAALTSAERLTRDFWTGRHDILSALDDLPGPARRQARADLLELALLWADLRLRLASPERAPAARRAALDDLAEMDRFLGPCAAVFHEQARLAERLGLHARARRARHQAEQAPPRTGWEHYALGCWRLRAGDLDGARLDLERAVEAEPRSFWGHLHLGRCNLRLGRDEEALVAFTVCVALEPDRALCHLHRGVARARLGQRAAARRDAERALQLEPGNREALALREALRREE
jgi:tetratricopeptide (TPR) repeat protein